MKIFKLFYLIPLLMVSVDAQQHLALVGLKNFTHSTIKINNMNIIKLSQAGPFLGSTLCALDQLLLWGYY